MSERTLRRPWPVFELIRPRKSQTRPIVLSPQEVRHLLGVVHNPKARMCRRMIYACGRRRTEGTRLQVTDIDAQRMLVRVHQGQGGKDRVVPLAPRGLAWWREDWQRERPRPWGFPARHRSAPLSPTSLQKTFNAVVRQSGLLKDASLHPRRHSSATHLLDRGVPLRVIQALLGHNSPSTTARSTPLPPPTLDGGHATITALMADL